MKQKLKWLLLAAATVGAKLLMPFQSSDVARLVPVEALVVSVEQGQVKLDGGNCQGRGATWAAAVQDLRQGAEGKAFLGTAEQIVLCGTAAELLPEVAADSILRPAATVCVCVGNTPDAQKAASFLSAHDGGVTLQRVRAMQLRGENVELPVLVQTEGGLRLYGP